MPMRVKFQHNDSRRELFPVWNQFTHDHRPITVNRAFHAFSRGELMEFPESLSPSDRKIQLVLHWLAGACGRLVDRWFPEEAKLQHFALAQAPGPTLQKADGL